MKASPKNWRRPSTPMTLVGVVSAVLFSLGVAGQAQAAFTSSPAASTTIATATLAPPTGVGLTATCGVLSAFTPSMTASWTATTSTFATGYRITPYLNGAAQTAVFVAGRSTTSTSIDITRNTLTTTNTWTFQIVALLNTSWTSTSVDPSPASVACPFLSL
jgi:hypothetical protein